MGRRYTYEDTLCVDGENDLEVKVTYTVTWGHPATGPTYDCGGTPADPDEIDDIRVETVNGKPRPWAVHGFGDLEDKQIADLIEAKLHDEHWNEMIASAAEEREAERWEAAERRWEEERDDALVRKWEADQ